MNQTASRKDGNGNTTTYAYDGFDRLSTTTFPDSSTELLTYDSRSNILTFKKRAGQVVTNAYDNTSRLTQSSYSSGDPTVTYNYDGLGREITLTRMGVSTLTYTYDGLGRRSSVDQDGKTISYQYDIAGRRTRLTHPDGFYVSYAYSPAAQLLTIKENGAATLVSYAYDGLGRATSLIRANGITTNLTYDLVSRLASYNHSTLVNASFTYNPSSQLTTRTVSNTAFTYKALTDKNLNYAVNNLNQYTTATGTTPATFAHDLNGNMTGDGAGNTYAYDALNRMTSVSGTNNASLTYGPKGKLIQIASGGTTTQFLYDGDALIAEYVSGAVANRYAHGAGVDNPIVWYEGAGTATKSYLTTDERGSIIGITDASGANTHINAYDEWGVPSANNIGRFQYTGQMWIDELGLYYYKARIYAPKLGRFMQTDPIGYDDGMNMYAYVGGDPVNMVDPSGLCGSRIPGHISAGCSGQTIRSLLKASRNKNGEDEDEEEDDEDQQAVACVVNPVTGDCYEGNPLGDTCATDDRLEVSLGLAGTLFGGFFGTSVGGEGGISIPYSSIGNLNLNGLQLVGTGSVTGLAGVGAFVGGGSNVSTTISADPIPDGFSGSGGPVFQVGVGDGAGVEVVTGLGENAGNFGGGGGRAALGIYGAFGYRLVGQGRLTLVPCE